MGLARVKIFSPHDVVRYSICGSASVVSSFRVFISIYLIYEYFKAVDISILSSSMRMPFVTRSKSSGDTTPPCSVPYFTLFVALAVSNLDIIVLFSNMCFLNLLIGLSMRAVSIALVIKVVIKLYVIIQSDFSQT